MTKQDALEWFKAQHWELFTRYTVPTKQIESYRVAIECIQMILDMEADDHAAD